MRNKSFSWLFIDFIGSCLAGVVEFVEKVVRVSVSLFGIICGESFSRVVVGGS